MSELPGITARELARDFAFQQALQNYAHANGSSETVAWCALRAIERAMPPGGAVAEVAAERRRQIEVEGWTPERDDLHTDGELVKAAAAYAINSLGMNDALSLWPWSWSWWKPRDRRRDLIRAAALIVAEIERLDRVAAREQARPDASVAVVPKARVSDTTEPARAEGEEQPA